MKQSTSLIRRVFSYPGKKLKEFLSHCMKRINRRVELMSDSLNRQFWIVKLFSLIGAGTVIYWTFLMVRGAPYEMVRDEFKDFVKTEMLGERPAPEVNAAFGEVRKKTAENIENQKSIAEVEKEIEAPEDVKEESKVRSTVREEWHPEKVKTLIRNIAEEEKFSDADLLVRIAQAESQLNPRNRNAAGNHPSFSVDRGLFMINDYWHKEVTDEQAYDPDFSTRWAIRKINSGGISAWDASKPNWYN